MIVLLLDSIVIVVAPWLARKAVVSQPGLKSSTASGMSFYFGHRPGGYGFTTDGPWPTEDDFTAGRLG